MDDILSPSEQFQHALNTFDECFQHLITLSSSYPMNYRLRVGVCGEWSAKNILEHLSAWIVWALDQYEQFDRAELNTWEYGDVDEFNADAVAKRVDHTWEQSLQELRQLVGDFHARALHVSAEQVNQCEGYAQWLQTLGEDAIAHHAEMLAFMETEA